MPLVRSFLLSKKKGNEAWVEPVVNKATKRLEFKVRRATGDPPNGTVDRRGARCIFCASPVPLDHVRAEGRDKRMTARLMAMVAEGKRGRMYLAPDANHELVAAKAYPSWTPDTELPEQALGFRVQLYGMTSHRDLFTARQLVALTTFNDLVPEARERVLADMPGTPGDRRSLNDGGSGAEAYADAIATYLALAASRLSDYSSTICTWHSGRDTVRNTFGRPTISMTWDFAEANAFSESTGNFQGALSWICQVVTELPEGTFAGRVRQLDATAAVSEVPRPLFSTDPPYYDNIGYADLSDFFYVWLRHSIGATYPELFSTLLTPKDQELVASPHRFDGSSEKAEQFFERGLRKAFEEMREAGHPEYPLTVFYAFKQTESEEEDDEGPAVRASTGWETMLEGLLASRFTIVGTWPMRSELSNRPRAMASNALASSIVLVCRPRLADAPLATRAEFLRALKSELPVALRALQHGSIAPVDLAQAAIGPGMAVFSRYSKVLEADGSPMRVRTALGLINQILDEVIAEQESEYDPATRWAVAWFEQFGVKEGAFGVAETLSKAKNTSVEALRNEGMLSAGAGKVRLLSREELDPAWDPTTDRRLTVWEITQYLVRALEKEGERGAAALLRRIGSLGEIARDLAYRLFTTCEKKKWPSEALAYNSLVVAWPEIVKLAAQREGEEQSTLGV